MTRACAVGEAIRAPRQMRHAATQSSHTHTTPPRSYQDRSVAHCYVHCAYPRTISILMQCLSLFLSLFLTRYNLVNQYLIPTTHLGANALLLFSNLCYHSIIVHAKNQNRQCLPTACGQKRDDVDRTHRNCYSNRLAHATHNAIFSNPTNHTLQ